MVYSTLDLLTRSLYSRDIPDAEAIEVLERRGWKRQYRFLFLLCVTPVVLPERIVCALGGDDWDDGPTTWKDIQFSCAFSIAMVAPFAVIYGIARFTWSCFAGECQFAYLPYISALLLLPALLVLRVLRGYRA